MGKAVKADGGGLRYNAGKGRPDLLAWDFFAEVARVAEVGAKKYADRNWERGMTWGHCFSGIMRHAWAFWRGEAIDPETGCHHLAHAAWNCMALWVYHARQIGDDNRGLDA